MSARRPLMAKLGDKVDYEHPAGCWQWTGALNRAGYGQFTLPGNLNRRAHRVVFELVVGPIPQGMQLDHLCRNRACVNPEHLEPVTGLENLRRSVNSQAAKTRCKNGHEFTAENTYAPPSGRRRMCRVCLRAANDRFRARKAVSA